MKCPHDGTTLAPVHILNVQLDKCHKCDGIWFDRGELERLRDANIPDIEELLEQKYGDPEFESGEVDGYMRCPRCGDARLQRQQYTYLNPVVIDRCERCLGIWIDDSELNAIIGEKKTLEQSEEKLGGFLGALAQRFGIGKK